MRWIKLGASGAYPDEVRKLRGKSGVYAIRSIGGWLFKPEILYVGQSSTGNLYQTMTRHFQRWHRRKKASWYPVQYVPEQTDPGHTYQRGKVEVSFLVGRDAGELESRWIRKLKPRDNRAGVPAELDPVPF